MATAATIGTVALPALRERRYDERLSLGSIAAGAPLGILIPPSIDMIIYGSMSNTSIGQLFMAGIVPGLVMLGLFTAMILLILVAAQFLNFIIGIMGVPQALTGLVTSMDSTQLEVILLLVLVYLVLGCFLETLSMMVASIPVVMPIVLHFDMDPVWFGVFMVVMMEVTLITPSIGMNLYVVQGVRGEGQLVDVIIGALPFVIIMLATVALLIAVPGLALWLPKRMFGL